jgi:hypothetical protein
MPRIPPGWLGAIVYIYPSVDDAENERQVGASGFMASILTEGPADPTRSVLYAVTNSHAVASGTPVIRINRANGGVIILPVPIDHWVHHPDNDDLAAAPLPWMPESISVSVPLKMMLTREDLAREGFGPGDEAFFFGRYVDLGGREENQPVVRFGNVSRIQGDPIWQPERSYAQEAILVEARSLSGFSGSPVCVYSNSSIRRNPAGQTTVQTDLFAPCYVLGVHFGHHRIREPVRPAAPGAPPIEPRLDVFSNSGLMMVVPSWKVLELLNSDHLVEVSRDVGKQVLVQGHRVAVPPGV